MPKTIQKEDVKVKLVLRPGPLTPAMKMVRKVWWARLLASVREELDSEEKIKHA